MKKGPSRWLSAQRGFFGVAAYYFLNGAMWPSIASRIPAIASKDHLSPQLLGLALVGEGLGLAVAMPFGGQLVDRWGARRVAVVSGAVFAACTALPGWAPSAATLFASLVLWGVANAPLDAAANVLAASLPDPARGSKMARIELAFSAGMLTGVGLGAWLAGWVSPQIHLSLIAAGGIAIALAAAPLLPRDASSEQLDRDVAWRPYLARHAMARRGRAGRRHAGPRTFRLRRVGYRRPLGRLALLATLGLWLESVPDWSGLFLQHELGAGPAQYNLGNIAFLVALSAVQIPAGTVLPIRWQRPVLMASGIIFAAGMALATTTTALPVAVAGFALCGAGAATIQPFAVEAGTRLFGSSGAVISRMQTPAYLGGSLEKVVTGVIAGRFGYARGLQTMIPLAGLVFVVGLSMKSGPPDQAKND